jgi:hypothetical protein
MVVLLVVALGRGRVVAAPVTLMIRPRAGGGLIFLVVMEEEVVVRGWDGSGKGSCRPGGMPWRGGGLSSGLVGRTGREWKLEFGGLMV